MAMSRRAAIVAGPTYAALRASEAALERLTRLRERRLPLIPRLAGLFEEALRTALLLCEPSPSRTKEARSCGTLLLVLSPEVPRVAPPLPKPPPPTPPLPPFENEENLRAEAVLVLLEGRAPASSPLPPSPSPPRPTPDPDRIMRYGWEARWAASRAWR